MLGEVNLDRGAAVVTLHGDLDLNTVDDLRELLGQVSDGPARLVEVDVGDVAFMDVLSLSVILGTADAMREAGRQLVMKRASAAVRRICSVLNASDILAPGIPLPRAVG
jgi:anti-anti-sigma factor